MNARTIPFELSMAGRQVDEVVASIFHTVLFHRSSGKFTYNNEESYSIRTVGYLDVDCDFIDFTYICCESETLGKQVKEVITEFSELLRGSEATSSPARGQISLEFFQKRKSRWPFPHECLTWELWTVYCELTEAHNEQDMHSKHESIVETLQEKIVFITDIINRHDYVPKMPSRSDVDLIFDTSFPDIQPYLFKIKYNLTDTKPTSFAKGFQKILQNYL